MPDGGSRSLRAGLAFGMFQWEPPVFEQPFELWRDEGVLHLVLADDARMGTREMKEVLRLIRAMDREGQSPVVIGHAPGVTVADDARRLLARVCRAQGHPVVVHCADARTRDELERFRAVYRPQFPFKVCAHLNEAWRWARERQQLRKAGLHAGSSQEMIRS
jgi:hypothetical protein